MGNAHPVGFENELNALSSTDFDFFIKVTFFYIDYNL